MKFPNGKKIQRADSTPKFPPALAHYMVGLGVEGIESCNLYDPFVGKGTILIAGGLNFPQVQKLYGNDLDEEASVATEINLDQVKKVHEFPEYSITNENAINYQLDEKNIVVVTDPPFGRACQWNETIDDFLGNLKKQDVKRVVMCYDKNTPLDETIQKHYNLIHKEKKKDRLVYVMEN